MLGLTNWKFKKLAILVTSAVQGNRPLFHPSALNTALTVKKRLHKNSYKCMSLVSIEGWGIFKFLNIN
jgi:hypothetical protein